MTLFQSLPDGEWAMCKSCHRKGYGPDAMYPATSEFFCTDNGKLRFDRCKACRSETLARTAGFVHIGEMVAAKYA